MQQCYFTLQVHSYKKSESFLLLLLEVVCSSSLHSISLANVWLVWPSQELSPIHKNGPISIFIFVKNRVLDLLSHFFNKNIC